MQSVKRFWKKEYRKQVHDAELKFRILKSYAIFIKLVVITTIPEKYIFYLYNVV